MLPRVHPTASLSHCQQAECGRPLVSPLTHPTAHTHTRAPPHPPTPCSEHGETLSKLEKKAALTLQMNFQAGLPVCSPSRPGTLLAPNKRLCWLCRRQPRLLLIE